MKSLVARAQRGARKCITIGEEGEMWLGRGTEGRDVVLGAEIGLLLDLGDTHLVFPS